MSFEVEVDHEICTGSASCTNWQPKVFALDPDTGLAVVVDPRAASEDEIVTVARACPSGAIVVRRDGIVLAGSPE